MIGYPEIQTHLRSLLEFKTEDAHLDKTSDFYESGDEDAPFFTEAYLYNLLGKEDARSILTRLRRVCSAAGMTNAL